MYIWVILAMFMASMFSFNLYHRADLGDVLDVPLAEALASKVYNQHTAALALSIRNQATIFEESGGSMGEIDYSELAPYTKHGFNVDDNRVVTKFHCHDKNDAATAITCNDPNADAFLITFMKIPTKWSNPNSHLPSKDLSQAIRNIGGLADDFGYTLQFNAEDKIQIQNTDTAVMYIPDLIALTDPDFATNCRAQFSCIVSISKDIKE